MSGLQEGRLDIMFNRAVTDILKEERERGRGRERERERERERVRERGGKEREREQKIKISKHTCKYTIISLSVIYNVQYMKGNYK